MQLNVSFLKRFVSLKGIFFFPASIWRLSLSFCLPSGVAGCLDPFFSCPPTSALFVERGPSPPPLHRAVGWGVVDGSLLNLNCKFQFFPAENGSLVFQLLFISTTLIGLSQRKAYSGWAAIFIFFSSVFFYCNYLQWSRVGFFKFPLLHYKMASLLCCFCPPSAMPGLGPP